MSTDAAGRQGKRQARRKSASSTKTLLPFDLAVDVRCSQCGQSVQVSIPQVVDLENTPDRRVALVQGTAHDVACPHCATTLRFHPACVVWEPTQRKLLAFHAQSDVSESQNRFEALARSLRARQPDAADVAPTLCASRGALVDTLLSGQWDDPEAAGLAAQGIWRGVYPRLPQAVRVRIFDILAKGTQQDVVVAANREPDLAAALQLATDPDATTHTGLIRAALEAVSESATRDPTTVVDAILSGLVECASEPARHGPMRNLLHLALGTSAQRLPVDSNERTAAAWMSLLIRMPAALPATDRAIALFNLAANAADRLDEDPSAPMVGHELQFLFEAALVAGPPADLEPTICEKLGRLRLGWEPPEGRGLDDLRRAATQFQSASRVQDALRVWTFLMRWHAARTHRRVSSSSSAREIDDEANAAIEAGAAAMGVSSQLPPEVALDSCAAIV